MKVSSKVKTERTITLELTEKEAELLCALVGNTPSWSTCPLNKLFHEMVDLLPNRKISYSDFFRAGAFPTLPDYKALIEKFMRDE